LDPDVANALAKTIKEARRCISRIPQAGSRDYDEILQRHRERFKITTEKVWPAARDLIRQDITTESVRQALNDFYDKLDQLQQKQQQQQQANSQGNKTESQKLQKEIDQLKKELDPFSGLSKQARQEVDRKIAEAIKQQARDLIKDVKDSIDKIKTSQEMQQKLNQEMQELKEQQAAGSGDKSLQNQIDKKQAELDQEKARESKLRDELNQKIDRQLGKDSPQSEAMKDAIEEKLKQDQSGGEENSGQAGQDQDAGQQDGGQQGGGQSGQQNGQSGGQSAGQAGQQGGQPGQQGGQSGSQSGQQRGQSAGQTGQPAGQSGDQSGGQSAGQSGEQSGQSGGQSGQKSGHSSGQSAGQQPSESADKSGQQGGQSGQQEGQSGGQSAGQTGQQGAQSPADSGGAGSDSSAGNQPSGDPSGLKSGNGQAQGGAIDDAQLEESIREALEDKHAENGSRPFPSDQISEKTFDELEKMLDRLSDEKFNQLEQQAMKELSELEDAMNEALEGQLNEPGETHADRQERKESEQASKAAQERLEKEIADQQIEQRKIQDGRRASLSDYDKAYEDVLELLSPVYNRLRKAFRKMQDPDKDENQLAGDLNVERAMQAEADPNKLRTIWDQRVVPIELDHAFLLLADTSSSMDGGKAIETFKASVFLGELFAKLKTEYAIMRFDDDVESLKTFEDSIEKQEVKERIADVMNTRGGTNDAEAIRQAYAELLQRKEKFKFILVLSDSGSNSQEAMRRILNKIKADEKVVVVHYGLGNGTSDSAGVYPYSFGELKMKLSAADESRGEKSFTDVLVESVEDMLRNPRKYLKYLPLEKK
jgi:hypothetical protein